MLSQYTLLKAHSYLFPLTSFLGFIAVNCLDDKSIEKLKNTPLLC